MSSNLTSSYPQFRIEMDKALGYSVYVFDRFRLDRDRLMLYRDGSEIALPPKAVQTLLVLAENYGEIVSKEDLIQALWSDSVVEESNLSQYLYLLRKTLGKRPDGGSYIETLRRRGYRLTAEVQIFPEMSVANREKGDVRPVPQLRNVERHGNVFALSDWRDRETAAVDAEIVSTEPVHLPEPGRWPGSMAIGLASICVIAGILAVIYLFRSGASVDEGAAEQDILRLTNGIEIVDATISPDGNYFVYHEPDGKLNRMWLQQTGHSTRHEIIPASEGFLYSKTFSPDGQFVFFLLADSVGGEISLYRVPTLGGPQTKILTGINSSVSFSPDGREMVFFRRDEPTKESSYIIRASDGSGDERRLYTWQEESSFGGNAAWSADGKNIAFSLPEPQADGSATASIMVRNLSTGETDKMSRERWASMSRMQWSPDSRGVYFVGTKELEGMSTRRDQVYYISLSTGKSRKVSTEGSRHQGGSLGVTNDGAVIVVPYNRSSQIWAMDANGDSRTAEQLTSGLNDGRAGIAPLADGRVAYVARTGENLNVWVMNPDGSDQKQLTVEPSYVEELRSGGDGRYMVFAGYSDPSRPHLYRIDTDGANLRPITFGDGREIDSSLSNDGKWLAYDSVITRGTHHERSLWKMPIEGGEPISLARTDCSMPHFSPDDRYISCVRDQMDVLILSSEDGRLISTFRTPPLSTLNFGARWTPDGKAIAFIVSDKGISNIWIQPIDGGLARQLTDFTGGSMYHFAYSADSQRLFVARGNQIRDAVLIRQL